MTAAARAQASLESLPMVIAGPAARPGLERHAAPSTIGIAWLAAAACSPVRLAAFVVRVMDGARQTVQLQVNIGPASFLLNTEEARAVRPAIEPAMLGDVSADPLTRLLENLADTADAIAREGGL
jgi:hypothetical protein